MSKINISFNNKNYEIDEQSLSAVLAALKSHLSTTMNGTGAVITLDGISYNVDSTKLSATTANFVNHLGTISGTGYKVVVGGVEYSVGADKVAGAFDAFEGALGDLSSSGAGKLVEFNGDLTGWEYVALGDNIYIKVLDKPLEADDLLGATATMVATLSGRLELVPEYTKEIVLTEDGVIEQEISETCTIIAGMAGAVELIISVFGDGAEVEFPLSEGTYFHLTNYNGGYIYTKSISCLTEDV